MFLQGDSVRHQKVGFRRLVGLVCFQLFFVYEFQPRHLADRVREIADFTAHLKD
jgi:hypothetical protein